MLISLLLTWLFFGLLAFGQFCLNLAIAPIYQIEISKGLHRHFGYSGYEQLGFILGTFVMLLIALITGFIGFAITQLVFKKAVIERFLLEKENRKEFGKGWCS